MVSWDIMSWFGRCQYNQCFPCSLLLYPADKETAGFPEILVPSCQTAHYQMNSVIFLKLTAMKTSNLIFRKLPNREYNNKNNNFMRCNVVGSDRNSKFHSNILLPSSTASSSKLSVNVYQNMWHHIPKHSSSQTQL
jgi:hypothetical protein